MMRVFVDTNVFFSACYSESGASFELLQQSLQGNVLLVISSFVLEETARNLAAKSPEDLQWFEDYKADIAFEIVDPTSAEVLAAASYTELKDAPIVAAAKHAQVDFLVSHDRRHLVGVAAVSAGSGLAIVLPEELLRLIRQEQQS